MRKFVIYTAIFGDAGRFNFPKISISRVDKICFTNLAIKSGCHQMMPVRKGRFKKNDFYDMKIITLNHLTPVMQQRFMKICIPDEIFDNYEYSAYVDCKRPIGINFERCEKLLSAGKSDFLTREHPVRDCIYAEGQKCLDVNKGRKRDIRKQLRVYRGDNYPRHNGLFLTSWLFRRHTEQLKEFSKLWWKQLRQFSHRDQISLPYVAWKHGMEIITYRGSE